MPAVGRLIAAYVDLRRIMELRLGQLDIRRQVYEDRPRPSRRGDMERFLYRPREVLDVLDQVIMLRYRPSYAEHVGLLERVVAYHERLDLPGYRDHRYRVHIRGRYSRDEVRRARARCRYADAGFTGHARVAVCRVSGGLLVPDEVELKVGMVYRVEERQCLPARIAEDGPDAFFFERFDEYLRPVHLGCHFYINLS